MTSEEKNRHKFNRSHLYTLLFTFLSVTMTFIIFTSTAVATITCSSGQFVTAIGTANDSCGKPLIEHGTNSCVIPVPPSVPRCTLVITFPTAFSSTPQISTVSRTGSVFVTTLAGTLYLFKTEPTGNGTWSNFPTSAQCPFAIQTSLTVPDSCEFLFTNSSRAVLLNPGYDPTIQLVVDCRTASNTAGAFVGLQVADFSTTTGTNTTLFTDAFGGHQVRFIDNAVHGGITERCPGISTTDGAGSTTMPTPGDGGWIFRIFGSGGGGVGDNPVFGDIHLQFGTGVSRQIQVSAVVLSAISFTAQASMIVSPTSPVTVNFDWIATNTP